VSYDLIDGYWRRAGLLRAMLVKRGHKAKLADVLIAQSCLDHRVLLITTTKEDRLLRFRSRCIPGSKTMR
jgi:predicted nucleic acid-binding protein